MASITAQIENIPGFSIAMDAWNMYAGKVLQTKDPYYEELPNGTTRRRKAPEGTTPSDTIIFKKIVSSAWKHDRCMCGCFWADWGLGLAPLICLVPIIGPYIMYTLHLRLNTMAEELHIPSSLHVKMTANVTFDFLITLIPVLGAVFSYLNACSTRNAALIHTFLMKRGLENQARMGQQVPLHTEYTRIGSDAERFQDLSVGPPQAPRPTYQTYRPQSNNQPESYGGKIKSKGKSGPMETGIR
ncbi:hypothetical protein V1509DRAFT_623131 [Lipomyces kononenkoae]